MKGALPRARPVDDNPKGFAAPCLVFVAGCGGGSQLKFVRAILKRRRVSSGADDNRPAEEA